MGIAALMGDDGEFTQVQVVSTKGGWTTIVDADGETRKVRNSQLADWSDDMVESVLTDDEGEGDDGLRTGNVFPRHIRETYVKGKAENGKAFIDCADDVAETLRGMEIVDVAKAAAQVLGDTPESWIAMYTTDRELAGKAALNPGMVRMNLGNRIRAELIRQAKEAAEFSNPETADVE